MAARHARSLAGLAVAVAVAGCLTTTEALVDRPWKLVEVSGAPPTDPGGIVGIAFGPDGRFQLNTGCNSGGGTYHVEGNRILIDTEILQPSPCDEAMAAQEGAIRAVVDGRPTFAVEAPTGQLRLATTEGAILRFTSP